MIMKKNVASLDVDIYNRSKEKKLSNLRDTLWPKLMNGEIEVKELGDIR